METKMIYSVGDPKKEISLQIKTLVIDEDKTNLIAGELESLLLRALKDELTEAEISEALGEDATDEIELCTEATIGTTQDGTVEIVYHENENDAQIATLSKIIFRPESPNLLAMTKKGAINTVLSFEEGRMHICAYDTPYMPFKVYVSAKTVDNRLLTEGKLKLDYVLNINDTMPQHFVITALIKDAPSDILKDFLK